MWKSLFGSFSCDDRQRPTQNVRSSEMPRRRAEAEVVLAQPRVGAIFAEDLDLLPSRFLSVGCSSFVTVMPGS